MENTFLIYPKDDLLRKTYIHRRMSPYGRIVKPFGCEFQSHSVRLKIKTSDLQAYKPPKMVHFARALGHIEVVFFVADQGVRQSEVYEELQ